MGFRELGKEEKYKPQNVASRTNTKVLSLIVWACFAGNICGPLVSFQGVNTAVTYANALQENLQPFIHSLPSISKWRHIPTRQCNNPYRSCYSNLVPRIQHCCVEWPPNSPDMSPIEHPSPPIS